MRSLDGRSTPNVATVKKTGKKKPDQRAVLEPNSRASSTAKVSKASSVVQGKDTVKPPVLASSSKASSSDKSSKVPSVVHSRDKAFKADAREGVITKAPLGAEGVASREPFGTAVEKDRAKTTEGKTDKTPVLSRDPSDAARPKNPKDSGKKAGAEEADTSLFDSADSVLYMTAYSDNKGEGKKEKLISKEGVTNKKDEGGAKEKEAPSPAPSPLPAPAVIEEKAPVSADVETKAKAATAPDKKPSTSSTKSNAKNRASKNPRKKRGSSRGNKAVQTTPDGEKALSGTPIHILFSPSSCSLCESNAPPQGSYAAMQSLQFGKYGAVVAAPTAQRPSRGARKTVRTTTTTTRRVQDGTRTPRSLDLVEEVTTEDVREAANTADGSKTAASTSTAGGLTKKTVTTTARTKDRDKLRKSSDTSDGAEGTITEVVGGTGKEAKRASVEMQREGSSAKKSVASVAPKKTVRTVRRVKNAEPRPRDDLIETVTTEVVEVESEPSPAQTSQQLAAPIIAGVARDSSGTQYRYLESRRPASAPYRTPRRVGSVNQRVQLRPPRYRMNQPHRHMIPPYFRPCRRGIVQHIPGCRFAALSQRGISAWAPSNFCQGHHGHLCQRPPTSSPLAAHVTSSSYVGLAAAGSHPCEHHHDDTRALVSTNTLFDVPPAPVLDVASVRSLANSSDLSEGTYDVFYDREPNQARTSSSGMRYDVRRRPTDFIWETQPREELVYSCANITASPAAHPAKDQCGVSGNDDADGRNQTGVDARAAPAATDLSMTTGTQVTRMSPEETLFFL